MLRAFYAADRDRTGTLSPARDFKSLASASSATAAHLQLLYRNRGRLSICVEERRWIWYTNKNAFCRGGFLEKDIQQHYAGWLFYRQSALPFPLCITPAINAPQGVSVAYTDSIPLVAAVCRPLAELLGGTFQYFGWFTLLCFVLQGGFGALLCGLFASSAASAALGSLLFVASPILYERALRHTSLG